MRIPNELHRTRAWLVSEIAPDFRLLDAWGLPIEGDRADFAAAVELVESFDPARSAPAPARLLFQLRFAIGKLLGWDRPGRRLRIPDSQETTLVDRLPPALRATVERPQAHGFVPLFRSDTEWAAEISNSTVHGVLQLGWVEQPDGRWRGCLGVYVRPRGRRGELYLRLIGPFRHLVVYPQLITALGAAWRRRGVRTP